MASLCKEYGPTKRQGRHDGCKKHTEYATYLYYGMFLDCATDWVVITTGRLRRPSNIFNLPGFN